MKYFIDDFILFRGVVFVRGWVLSHSYKIELIVEGNTHKINYKQLKSPDLVKIFGDQFKSHRFEFNVDIGEPWIDKTAEIKFILDNESFVVKPIIDLSKRDDSFNFQNVYDKSFRDLNKGKVIEVGSRARSGNVNKHLFDDFEKYIGLDVLEGENVDVIGDVHKMSSLFDEASVDCIFSVSVFEHLINPLKAIYEMNKVLKIGGICQINTHQTWPVHDAPWDFCRFSKYAWFGFFNKTTGFEIIKAVQGERAYTATNVTYSNHKDLDYERGFLSSKVIAKKIAHVYEDIPYDENYMVNTYPA